MKNSILKLKGAQVLSRNEQKEVNGGSTGCFAQACGITPEQCTDELQGRFNKITGCCGYVPLSQSC